jgi:hypothetical protein
MGVFDYHPTQPLVFANAAVAKTYLFTAGHFFWSLNKTSVLARGAASRVRSAAEPPRPDQLLSLTS